MKILILHGPNMNLLGNREPEIYGELTLEDINSKLVKQGKILGVEVICQQSNHEGVLIDVLQEACNWAQGIVFNPGGYTHTSVALRDVIAAIGVPVVEVHLSNVDGRESFRKSSTISGVCKGKIVGFGWRSYALGLQAVVDLVQDLNHS
jgi:3-dehydroquinate dehydratase-2